MKETVKVPQVKNEFGVKEEQEEDQGVWSPVDEGEEWQEVMFRARKICRSG